MMTRITINRRRRRQGNILVGCLVALGIAVILAVIATVFVMNSWRGWMSGGLRQGITAVLDETKIQQVEKDEINAHIETLMTRFENKDLSLEDLGNVTVAILEGPLLPAGIVAASYEGYFAESELDDEVKADAKNQLGRVAHGIYTEAISIDDLEDILDPIKEPTGSGNSGVQVQAGNQNIKLKEPDNVTSEELVELVANARMAADEAGVVETAPTIDLSNEVGLAIANALGEDPSMWLPEGTEIPVEDDAGSDDAPDDAQDDGASADPTTPDDGP